MVQIRTTKRRLKHNETSMADSRRVSSYRGGLSSFGRSIGDSLLEQLRERLTSIRRSA